MTYRNQALLDIPNPKFGNDVPCLIQIGGICNGRNVVACHSNWQEHNKGVGLKSDDCYIAYGCENCHRAIDRQAYQLEPEDRRHYWQRGFERTILWLFEHGHLKVIL